RVPVVGSLQEIARVARMTDNERAVITRRERGMKDIRPQWRGALVFGIVAATLEMGLLLWMGWCGPRAHFQYSRPAHPSSRRWRQVGRRRPTFPRVTLSNWLGS